MKWILILLFFPLLVHGQLYYTKPTTGTTTTPYIYNGDWSPPSIWADSLGVIDITDGRALAASTIKILDNDRSNAEKAVFKTGIQTEIKEQVTWNALTN